LLSTNTELQGRSGDALEKLLWKNCSGGTALEELLKV
jgi:hypothetical protein